VCLCVCVCVFRGSVKETCKMLMALGISSREVYEDDFEKPLLSESREFYRVSLTVELRPPAIKIKRKSSPPQLALS